MPSLETIRKRNFDLAVIGGGITGAGIARDASLRGMSVVLFDQGDFAEGTSSRSSKLIHGGLRYLERLQFGLVKEALLERSRLQSMAPHLVRPLPFLVPIYPGNRWNKWKLKLGLTLYDKLAGAHNIAPHQMLSRRDITRLAPGLRADDIRGGAVYYDCQMNDARLCLENILDAVHYGAVCKNHVKVQRIIWQEGRAAGVTILDENGESMEIRSRVVISASGAWTDPLLQANGIRGDRVRPSRGSHIVLPKLSPQRALLLTATRDRRVFFVIPWGNASLVGTTEIADRGDPAGTSVSDEEKQYLLREINYYFPQRNFHARDVIAAYAGIRPLVMEKGKVEGATSREHRIEEIRPNLYGIWGGKFTTYRCMAEQLVDRVADKLHKNHLPCDTHLEPLPGGLQTPSDLIRRPIKDGLNEDLRRHLVDTYGAMYLHMAACIRKDPELARPLVPGREPVAIEVVQAFAMEMAGNIKDLMYRRTRLGYEEDRGEKYLPAVRRVLIEKLHKDPSLVDRWMADFKEDAHP